MAERILIVDDDPVQRRFLEGAVQQSGFATVTAETGDGALAVLTAPGAEDIALVILDLVLPELDGMGVLLRMRDDGLSRPVIVQCQPGGVDAAVGAIRAGAVDFFIRPVRPERLEISIRNALKVRSLEGEIARTRRHADGTLSLRDIVARSAAMQRVATLGERAASSGIPIIIEGDPGVGKELVARAIHGSSARAGGPFVALNCGAIPASTAESILFGHQSDAVNGTAGKLAGKFVEADGGTLYLEEVGELPPTVQKKLLRALHDGDVQPVGSRRPARTDVRLISATSRSMIELVQQGRFREDLYYRLNVFPVLVPPLRERRADVPLLVAHFLARLSAEEGKCVDRLTPEAMALLTEYHWPGNVRQLENAIVRAVLLSDSHELDVDHFPQIAALPDAGVATHTPHSQRPPSVQAAVLGPTAISAREIRFEAAQTVPGCLGTTAGSVARPPGDEAAGLARELLPILSEDGDVRPLEEIEAELIRFAVEHYRGRLSEVARRLGIGRSTLYRRLKELEPDAAE